MEESIRLDLVNLMYLKYFQSRYWTANLLTIILLHFIDSLSIFLIVTFALEDFIKIGGPLWALMG